MRSALQALSALTCATLLTFSARRALFTLVMLRRVRAPSAPAREDPLNVLVLVACRDEVDLIDDLVHAIDALDYPLERRQVVLIDDASTDGTAERMRRATVNRPGWFVLHLEQSLGKAAALNAALQRYVFGEVVYVLDADHRPAPNALRRLVGYFADPRVGGVSGRTVSRNMLASPIAYYSTVESLVHQLVTMRAKDRLDLAPALLGANCGYRRSALVRCGWFRPGALLEDYDLTLALYASGYRVRFVEDVVSTHTVPESVRGYLQQHVRWGRGIYDVARDHARSLVGNRRLPLTLRIELALFMAGYLDRLALVAAITLSAVTRFPRAVLAVVLLMPMLQIIALFAEQRASRAVWLRLPIVPLMLALDILAALQGIASALSGRPLEWLKTDRGGSRRD